MKKPKYFNCYFDNEVLLDHLSDEQAGKLWKSLFAFVNRDEQHALSDPVVALAYEVMAQQIKRDFAKYDEKCEKNKKNRAIANERQRTSTNVTKKKKKKKIKKKTKTKIKKKTKKKKTLSRLSGKTRRHLFLL